MAIVIKELIIRGKVVKDLPNIELNSELIEEYLEKIKDEVIEEWKERVKIELEREFMK